LSDVLITRPADDAAATAARIKALGFTPVVAPVMEIRHLTPNLPDNVQAILVTSGNAVAGLAPAHTRVLAVGDVTAARARARGFTDVLSAGRDAEALAELAAGRLRPSAGPLLLACGSGQGAAICADLRRRGFRVVRRVTYAAVPVRRFPQSAIETLATGRLHAAIFMSAETACIFARLLPARLSPRLQNVLALAIGKKAADALKALPWRQVRLARSPTLEDVLALL
jgi:uroporphyrinogen-III synthase